MPQRPSLLKPPARPQRPPVGRSDEKPEPSLEPENRVISSDEPKAANKPEVVTQQVEAAEPSPSSPSPTQAFTNHPIAPPSEPMQYRAIGLIRGTYEPSEKQLNRGRILAEDGAVVDAVLLGRVTSLIKKHINLEQPHLWVVYPRTRQATDIPEEEAPDGNLHLQIVGVWEPETLGMPGENPNTGEDESDDQDKSDGSETSETIDIVSAPEAAIADPASEAPVESSTEDTAVTATESIELESAEVESTEVESTEAESAEVESTEVESAETEATPSVAASVNTDEAYSQPVASSIPSENYFSIRGEVLNYDEDDQLILVKIVQGAKGNGKPPKAFKLHVSGEITGKTVGYFWDLDVERQGDKLVLTDSHTVGIVPPKKKKKGKTFGGPRKGRRPGPGAGSRPKPSLSKQKPRIRPSAPVKSNPL